MASEIFYCPHCRVSLTKSPQMHVLCELYENNSTFIGLGTLPENIWCPNYNCGKAINTMNVIKGNYDPGGRLKNTFWGHMSKFAEGFGGFFGFIGAVFGFAMGYSNHGDWNIVLATITGILAGAVIVGLAGFMIGCIIYLLITIIRAIFN